MNNKTMLVGLMAFAGFNNRMPADPLEGIDINKEFELIGKKKSNLSSSLRKLVIYRREKEK